MLEATMLKVIAILAAIVAATSSYAQEVRVFSGGIEHVYGPGGQLRDSPELRAKNQREERQMREEQGDGPSNFDRQRTITVETSRRQTPRSWWNQVPQQQPKSWWNQVPQQPPKSWWSDYN
jgi:hypothetical protein